MTPRRRCDSQTHRHAALRHSKPQHPPDVRKVKASLHDYVYYAARIVFGSDLQLATFTHRTACLLTFRYDCFTPHMTPHPISQERSPHFAFYFYGPISTNH